MESEADKLRAELKRLKDRLAWTRDRQALADLKERIEEAEFLLWQIETVANDR